MKRIIIITTNALLFCALMFSCNGGSSDNTSYYTEKVTSNTCSNDDDDVALDTKKTWDYGISDNSEKSELRSLCNTEWEFTDANGRKFVLKISDFSRTGESVKAELFKDGEHNANGTISLDCTNQIKFDFPSEIGKDKSFVYYPVKSSWLQFAYWDYECGFIYQNESALEAEDPDLRLKINRIK